METGIKSKEARKYIFNCLDDMAQVRRNTVTHRQLILSTYIIGVFKMRLLNQDSLLPHIIENTDTGLPWCQFASEITVLKAVKTLIMKQLEISCSCLGFDLVDATSVLSLHC